MSRVAAVVIGRNEGARLLRCFDSLRGRVKEIIYVDSSSQDGSVGEAEKRKIKVVRLDPDQPFTAARARGEGFNAVQDADFIQFVDGDCGVEPDWISRASGALEQDEALGLVTGWRTEISPETSVYNALCDFEWHRPAGEILTCGGDMMVRRKAYEAAGGFNPQVIAAEDGFYTFVVGTKGGFGVLRDPIACKPAVLAETDQYVAFGSEYRALVNLPGIESARVWEPEPATVYFWEHAA